MWYLYGGRQCGKTVISKLTYRLNKENQESIEKYGKPLSEFHISPTESQVLERFTVKHNGEHMLKDCIGTVYQLKLIVDRKDD